MGARVHLDTSAAHAALDELEARIRKARTITDPGEPNAPLNPAAVAQAQRRYNRRNGVAT